MKRNVIAALAAIALAAALCCCGNEGLKTGEAFSGEVNGYDGIRLLIDDTTVTPYQAKFVILNTTDKQIESGKPHSVALHVRRGGAWYPLISKNEGGATTSELYRYPQNEPRIVEVSWAGDYGMLPAGKYRIVKGFFEYNGPGMNRDFLLADEFTISG